MQLFCKSSKKQPRLSCVRKCCTFRDSHLNHYSTLKKKLPISFSHTLDDLHTLDKFSFTFRSSRSQIIFKIDVLKILQYPRKNTCIGVSYQQRCRPSILLKRLQHRYFPVNIAKFLGTASFIEHLCFCTLNNYNVKF